MTVLSKVLDNSKEPNFDDPAPRQLIKKPVKKGKESNCVVGANPSYTHVMAKMRQRVKHLHEPGMGSSWCRASPASAAREAASHGNVAHEFRLRGASCLKEGHVCAGRNVSRTHLHEQCH
jgi:hypothetical protein